MLEIITFTGVDERTDLKALAQISEQYPQAEFAVLIGSQTAGQNQIFPPFRTVHAFRQLTGVRTALHLCGQYARQVSGEERWNHSLQLLCNDFGRVQVNLHGDHLKPERVRIRNGAIRRLAILTGIKSVILQHRGPWDTVPLQHPRVEYLFDLSEGSGQESFSQWPEPPEGRRAGYAGGLGPHNILQAMDFVDKHPAARLWLDMERNVRTPDYWFDLDKVAEVCRLALGNRDN